MASAFQAAYARWLESTAGFPDRKFGNDLELTRRCRPVPLEVADRARLLKLERRPPVLLHGVEAFSDDSKESLEWKARLTT